MIYLLHGTDTIKSRKKLRALLDSMLAKKPDASLIQIDDENFDQNQLKELIYGQGLFESKYIVVFDNVLVDKETKETVLKDIKEIGISQNIFVFLEGALDKSTLSKFEKHSKQIQIFRGLASENFEKKAKKFDIFSLTDALGRRDKKTLWVLYQKAKLNNIADEQIHGVLFWKIKSTLMSSKTTHYSEDELKKLSSSLVSLYHDSRRGIHKLSSALERFVLGLDK